MNTREAALKSHKRKPGYPKTTSKSFLPNPPPSTCLGYDIIEDDKLLGKILEVIEQPHQVLCRIDINGKEAYIPLHEETIIKMDRKNNRVIVALPPGLLEIYQ